MTQDVSSRVLRLFEVRLKNEPAVSPAMVETLFNDQRANDFGDDDDLLRTSVESLEDDE